ncbi:MAG: methylmalonyl Co-A mutase-associated GTPase MeaB, partial [Gammaproteobacteria bacterium]
ATKVVVCSPGLGDDIQAIKAGILEIADVLVVNKCDLPLINHINRQLKSMLALREALPDWTTPVLNTSAIDGIGVPELADAIDEYQQVLAQREGDGQDNGKKRMLRLLANSVADKVKKDLLETTSSEMDAICDAVLKGELMFNEATNRVIDKLLTR